VLLQLDVHPLVESHVHEVNRCSTFPDHLQIGSVLGVVKAPQLPIVNAKAVGPDMQNALLYWPACGRCRNGTAAGVGDRTALDAIAAENLACATENRSGGAGGFLVRLLGISVAAQR
jgi:hypothetical protein